MFSKILNRYRTWQVYRKLDHYTDLLIDLDGGYCKPEDYPVKLKEFWRLFDMSLLDDLTVRDVMGHFANMRFRTFGQMHQLFIEANDAIANEKDSLIEYITRTGIAQQADVYLDRYFQDHLDSPIGIKEAFEQLRSILQAHCGILENIDGSYGQRKMLHVYYDITVLTEELIDVIHSKRESLHT